MQAGRTSQVSHCGKEAFSFYMFAHTLGWPNRFNPLMMLGANSHVPGELPRSFGRIWAPTLPLPVVLM